SSRAGAQAGIAVNDERRIERNVIVIQCAPQPTECLIITTRDCGDRRRPTNVGDPPMPEPDEVRRRLVGPLFNITLDDVDARHVPWFRAEPDEWHAVPRQPAESLVSD